MRRAPADAGILLGNMAGKEMAKGSNMAKKRNPFDDYLDELEKYSEGTPQQDVDMED